MCFDARLGCCCFEEFGVFRSNLRLASRWCSLIPNMCCGCFSSKSGGSLKTRTMSKSNQEWYLNKKRHLVQIQIFISSCVLDDARHKRGTGKISQCGGINQLVCKIPHLLVGNLVPIVVFICLLGLHSWTLSSVSYAEKCLLSSKS